ncbi:NAD(P)H azoreductase [Cesiribacter andamanensis AMV16]|uniref:NAD(P)H azoreductase n=1 Tax=Cesiribacter andamanensis AMV16 TaxID=1279009 RepID=M7MXS6_9BACT|nr:NAD(P)H azoreductase [Cesiribacter andamanensis AMV16]
MVYTILRPSCFMETWLSPHTGFDYPNARASIFGQGNNKISWISLSDVAAFAVECLSNPAARNAVLELGGPEALSPHEVVQIFEEISGRPFELQHVPEESLMQQIATAQDSLQKTFSALMLSIAHGDPINMEKTLKEFPIRLTSVREYASRSLAAS